jgi:hypothetical protein
MAGVALGFWFFLVQNLSVSSSPTPDSALQIDPSYDLADPNADHEGMAMLLDENGDIEGAISSFRAGTVYLLAFRQP